MDASIGSTVLTALSDESGETQERRVSFGYVHVRVHEITMGDSPSCSRGPAIGLDWRLKQSQKFRVDEVAKEKKTSKSMSKVPPETRCQWLVERGYSERDWSRYARNRTWNEDDKNNYLLMAGHKREKGCKSEVASADEKKGSTCEDKVVEAEGPKRQTATRTKERSASKKKQTSSETQASDKSKRKHRSGSRKEKSKDMEQKPSRQRTKLEELKSIEKKLRKRVDKMKKRVEEMKKRVSENSEARMPRV